MRIYSRSSHIEHVNVPSRKLGRSVITCFESSSSRRQKCLVISPFYRLTDHPILNGPLSRGALSTVVSFFGLIFLIKDLVTAGSLMDFDIFRGYAQVGFSGIQNCLRVSLIDGDFRKNH